MLCAEYDYEMDMQVKGEEKFEAGKKAGEAIGEKRGKKIGEAKLARLINKLTEANRINEIAIAAKDEEARKKLYKEFGIE